MKRFLSLTACLAMVAAASTAFAATSGNVGGDINELQVAVDGPGVVITSATSSQALAQRETAGPDTFALYGGPDEVTEGKFQDINGVLPDAMGWVGVDQTDLPVFWHIDTFLTDNLNNNGAGNKAMWSGQTVADQPAWGAAPGYGNGWNDGLLYESTPVADNTASETVTLDFFFNHDTEPSYDYFYVQYDSAGTWTTVYGVDSTNRTGNENFGTYAAPGLQYSLQSPTAIFYAGNDYGGTNSDQIRIRMLTSSDGAWSDQDGLWPTRAGAAMVDDISMTNSVESFTETFEGAAPFKFNPDKSPFAGNFFSVYARITDLDPCRDNITPVAGFLDFGQAPDNGPGIDGTISTGGSLTAGIAYGISGNYVTNYTGGLSNEAVALTNDMYSPDILWDLPGTGDDGLDVSGAWIRFTVWTHLPLANGMFYTWGVRSALAGQEYGEFADRNFVYYGGGVPAWGNVVQNVTDLLQSNPERVSMRMGAIDYADVFGFPGTAATPSPVFDNAAFYKYKIGGASFATRTIDTFNDGFPGGGSIDVTTQASRDALDIPVDMARDTNSGDVVIDSGDSMIVDVTAVIPFTTVTDIRMKWALKVNPLFEPAIRTLPARIKDEFVVDAGASWTGEVVADTSKTSVGAIIDGRFFVDLPDVNFLYPGDQLQYYIEATDSDGRVTTLPGNTTGFGLFDGTYNRAFTINGLPSISDAGGTQPTLLVYNDFGRRGGENDFLSSFGNLGYAEGVQYDVYTTQGPSSGVSNGIGSHDASGHGHGAVAGQLAGYDHIFYFAGNLSTQLLSNGDPTVSGNDKSDDITLLQGWEGLGGQRNVAYFGDYIATALHDDSPEGLAYLNSTMGVQWNSADVGVAIGGQTAALVRPIDVANFATEFVAYGGCLAINQFDEITPLGAGASAAHGFVDPVTDLVIAGPAASVENVTLTGTHVTFPYSMMFVYNPSNRTAVGNAARTALFEELLTMFGAPSGGTATAAPSFSRAALNVFPNPFNPMTTVKFTAQIGAKGSVKVYDLSGRLVRTLHNGEFSSQVFTWDGTDNRGASVASGVYVIKAVANGQVETAKAALVK